MSIIAQLPYTLTNGQTADASQVMADLNQIRNDVNNNAMPVGGVVSPYRGAVVRLSGNITLTAGNTVINWDTEIQNTDNIHSIVVHPERLTAPDGFTKVRVSAVFPSGAITGTIGLSIAKNGGVVTGVINAVDSKSVFIGPLFVSCSPGDYFTVAAIVTGGDSVVLDSQFAQFEMELIG